MALDGGEPPRQSTCLINLMIVDVNDNAPKLLFEPASLTNFALVPENEIAGRIVAVFTVVDEDSGINGESVCWIESVIKNDERLTMEKKSYESDFALESKEAGNDETYLRNSFKLDLMALPFAKV